MYPGTQWYPYIQKLHQQCLHLTERIEKLERIIQEMQEEIDDIKQRKHFNIERIEYQFDQLKIEQLEGTLNIGITPGHAENIEKYAVHQKEMEDLQFSQSPASNSSNQNSPNEPEEKYSALFQPIYDQINNHLQENKNIIISSLRDKYEIELNREYGQMMIEDVKKQLDQRINFYLSQMKSSQLERHEVEKQIIEQTKTDIYGALDQHFQKIKEQGEWEQ